MSNRIKRKLESGRRAAELEDFVNGTMAALLDGALEKLLSPSSFVQQTVSKIWDCVDLMENDTYMWSIRLTLLAVIKGELTQSVLPQLLDKVCSKAQQISRRNGSLSGGKLDNENVLTSTIDSILHATKQGFLEVLDLNAQEMLHRITLKVAEQKYGKVSFRSALRTWRNIESRI